MDKVSDIYMTDKDWLDKGKSDAWAGKAKQPPEHDPQAASMYDLGYYEEEIERSPVICSISRRVIRFAANSINKALIS